jgi:hypothetical protein
MKTLIGRMIGLATTLVIYTAAATLLAEVILIGVAAWRWDISRDRFIQIFALAQGIDLFEMKEKAMVKAEQQAIEQVSHEEVLDRRALEFRDLERREQALQDSIEQLRFESRKLAEQRKRYNQVRGGFEAKLAEMREGAQADGLAEVRRILESIKPEQAKIQLWQMLQEDQLDTVVRLMGDMSDRSRSRIIGEFQTPQEQEQINIVLERILDGVPDAEVAQAAEKQFEPNEQPGNANR